MPLTNTAPLAHPQLWIPNDINTHLAAHALAFGLGIAASSPGRAVSVSCTLHSLTHAVTIAWFILFDRRDTCFRAATTLIYQDIAAVVCIHLRTFAPYFTRYLMDIQLLLAVYDKTSTASATRVLNMSLRYEQSDNVYRTLPRATISTYTAWAVCRRTGVAHRRTLAASFTKWLQHTA